MSESRTPRGNEPEQAGNGGRRAASSQIILPVKVQQAGRDQENWIGYTCQNPQEEPLSKVIHVVRESLDLDDSIELKVCTSIDGKYLDQNIRLETILAELRYGDYLITYIESVEEIQIETQEGANGEGVSAGVKDEKTRPVVQRAIMTSKQIQIGESEQRVSVHVRRPVISIEGGYVLIEQQLLSVLREKVERPLMLQCVYLFLGVTLGAIFSLIVALQDNKMEAASRGMLTGLLVGSVIASLFLIVLGYFVHAERKKALQPIINELRSNRIPSRTGSKSGDDEEQ
jgi:hypothetical protein